MSDSRFLYSLAFDPTAPDIAAVVVLVDGCFDDLFVSSSAAKLVARSFAKRVRVASSEQTR